MKNKNIFCEDCRYFKKDDIHLMEQCYHPNSQSEKGFVSTPLFKRRETGGWREECSTKNKNNNCKDFVKKQLFDWFKGYCGY